MSKTAETIPGTVPQLSEESVAIRPKSNPVSVTSTTKDPIEILRQQEEEIGNLANIFGKVKGAFEDNKKNLKRQIRNMVYNRKDYNESKKDEVKGLLKEAQRIQPIKPQMIKLLFVKNGIYYLKAGYTITEMAQAYIELCGMDGEWELRAIKNRVKMWISKANTEHDARITHKKDEDDGRIVYFIARHGRDWDYSIEKSGELGGRVIDGHLNRKELRKQMEKEEAEEQKEPQEIIVDTQGNEEVNK